MAWADYFWPDSSVLRNKLGITDAEALHDAEYRLAAVRRTEIARGLAPIQPTYDGEHLKALHGWLFQDVYEWAGRVRDVPISKMTDFAPLDRIEGCLQKAGDLIAETDWKTANDDRFASTAAEAFSWLNWAHCFRDGNGRATRTFMDEVARGSGRWLDYSVVSQAVWVQRASFSVPDLDQDRPQHHWLTPLFAVIARPLDTARELPERARAREQDSGYDLGL